MCIRLKKNGKNAKDISLMGQPGRAFKLTSTTSSGTCLCPTWTRSRLMTCWRRCQTNLGPSSATKSRLSTCWSEPQQISEWDGKLGLQSISSVWKGGRWCSCSHPSRWNHLGDLWLSWSFVHECAILSLGAAWLSVEISLKPLLTPDQWTILHAYFAYCFAYCSILFDISWFCIFCIL